MTPAHIQNILNKGEGLTVEFKKATTELPKNLFEIGHAEDLGTGIRNVFHLSTLYSGEKPVFNEEDLFEVIIPIANEKTTPKTTPKNTVKTTPKTQQKLIALVKEHPTISKKELAEKLGISIEGVRYHTRALKNKGSLVFIGSSKSGSWVIKDRKKT